MFRNWDRGCFELGIWSPQPFKSLLNGLEIEDITWLKYSPKVSPSYNPSLLWMVLDFKHGSAIYVMYAPRTNDKNQIQKYWTHPHIPTCRSAKHLKTSNLVLDFNLLSYLKLCVFTSYFVDLISNMVRMNCVSSEVTFLWCRLNVFPLPKLKLVIRQITS